MALTGSKFFRLSNRTSAATEKILSLSTWEGGPGPVLPSAAKQCANKMRNGIKLFFKFTIKKLFKVSPKYRNIAKLSQIGDTPNCDISILYIARRRTLVLTHVHAAILSTYNYCWSSQSLNKFLLHAQHSTHNLVHIFLKNIFEGTVWKNSLHNLGSMSRWAWVHRPDYSLVKWIYTCKSE